MKIDTKKRENSVVLAMKGDLDINGKDRFQNTMHKLIDNGEKQFFLDMSEVGYIDSSGLGALIVSYKKIRSRNGKLILCGLSPSVRKAFSLTSLDMIFDIEISLDKAKENY